MKALSADPTAKPEIQPNYLAVQIDRDALLAAMKYLRKLLATPPLADYVIRENFPGPDVQTDEQWMAHARATGSTTYHPVGTCKLGTDPMAVVDPLSMRVHRPAGPARRRCLVHADDGVGQHLRRHQRDRGERRRTSIAQT